MIEAPLGPIMVKEDWYFFPGGPYSDEGYILDGTYYFDQYGNEYNSVEHVLLCAVREALFDVV